MENKHPTAPVAVPTPARPDPSPDLEDLLKGSPKAMARLYESEAKRRGWILNPTPDYGKLVDNAMMAASILWSAAGRTSSDVVLDPLKAKVEAAKAALLAEFSRLSKGPQQVQCLYCTHISDLGKGIVVYPSNPLQKGIPGGEA
jgi:hypothetical protein